MFRLSDDEMVENLMPDPRYQYALHTTGFEEQPLSDKTLSRFRKRCYDYEQKTGIDLPHDCVADLGSKIAKMMKINPRIHRMDSMMIEANIKNLSRTEIEKMRSDYVMNEERLRNLLKFGKSKTVIVYCGLCVDYIGYVKTITIMNEKMVRIEYDTYGYDEAGLTFFAEYENLDILIKSMQEYIGRDIRDWKSLSLTNDYPQEIGYDFDINMTHRLIRQELLNDKIELPKYGKISLKEGYWKNLFDKSKEMLAD